MKISNILFTAALAFKYAYAKENTDVLNQYEENIKTKDFQYTFYCLDNYNDSCNLIKKDFKEALSILSNTFGNYFYFYFFFFFVYKPYVYINCFS